ncbi:hypothetical protein AB0A71_23525 [Kitasatospora aureofaciens]|uniref:hypothetical protein n=1 Tax=Kitasatospora aureofaciens TaxID=1894 RepID=UPI0033C92A41
MSDMEQKTPRAEEPGDKPPGLGKRLDAALTARGFTTRRLRIRAAAWALAFSLIPVGAAGFALYRLTNVGGPGSVCDGAATADEVHDLLGSGRIREQKSRNLSAAASDYSCSASVETGLFGRAEKTVWFHLERDTKDGPGTLAASDARLFSGDSAGSVTPGMAWALLPEGCEKGLRTEVHSTEQGHDETRARLAVGFANAAAKAKRCADGTLPEPKSLSARGAETDPDWANLCGLPGFAPAKNPEARWRMPQQVTTASGPIWSCKIGGDPRRDSRTQVFAITTDPRTTALTQKDGKEPPAVGRARWVADETLVVSCQGKDVFFTVSGGYTDALEKPFLFPDQKDLVQQFLTAGGRAIGCEPIM